MASTMELPSNLTVHQFIYSHKCFPRCNRLVRSVNCSFPEGHRVDVVCRIGYEVDKLGFALEADDKGNQYSHIIDLNPTVLVCILQCDKNGSLTEQDQHFLEYFKRYIDQPDITSRLDLREESSMSSNEKVVFVIEDKRTDKQLCTAAEEIAEKMKINKNPNDVFHRLFIYPSDEIGIRISLLLEKHTIARVDFKEKEKFKAQNEIDLQYHQLKVVGLRNEMICEFGVEEKNELIVSIEEFSNQDKVRNYFQKYIKNAEKIKIIQFEEMDEENLSLKSGDKVTSSINESFGTVGLILKDEHHYYCTTCNHVITNCLKSSNETSTSEDKCKGIIITTQNARFETDRIFTPSEILDFSAIKLVDTQSSSGLRRKDGNLVDGHVLSNDIPMIPYGTELYKWGAKTSLTTGVYTKFMERRKKKIYISIDNKDFALKGDSGSLICYSDAGNEIAAMILIGRVTSKGFENTYICHKLKDALVSLEGILKHDTNLNLC